MKHRSLSVGTAAAACVFLVGSAISPAVAVPQSHHGNSTSLVFYVENRSVVQADADADGALESGDMVQRELALSRTRGGSVIGVSYSQGEIVSSRPDAKTDLRQVNIQNQVPGGELFATVLVEYSALALPTPGWQEPYATIGGTGKYSGARGSGTMTLLDDGKTFKIVLKIMP